MPESEQPPIADPPVQLEYQAGVDEMLRITEDEQQLPAPGRKSDVAQHRDAAITGEEPFHLKHSSTP